LRDQFEELRKDLRTELSKAQTALKPFGIPASSNFEAAAYIHSASAQRLAKKIVGLCRALAYELENWARSYSSYNPSDIERLHDARRRREKALKQNPLAAQLTDGESYLATCANKLKRSLGKTSRLDHWHCVPV
jgi:hypothetical protein